MPRVEPTYSLDAIAYAEGMPPEWRDRPWEYIGKAQTGAPSMVAPCACGRFIPVTSPDPFPVEQQIKRIELRRFQITGGSFGDSVVTVFAGSCEDCQRVYAMLED